MYMYVFVRYTLVLFRAGKSARSMIPGDNLAIKSPLSFDVFQMLVSVFIYIYIYILSSNGVRV